MKKISLIIFISMVSVWLSACSGINEKKSVKNNDFNLQNFSSPYYFIAIHNEPAHGLPNQMELLTENYETLQKMIARADKYNIKLTLMLTAQWADLVFSDPTKLAELKKWEANGHEIAGHHHSVYHGNWDGYSNYSKKEIKEARSVQGENEAYLGTMSDYISKLKILNPKIKSGCFNEEGDKSVLPDEIIYLTCSGFANYGNRVAIKSSDVTDSRKGVNQFLTVGKYNNIERKWLAHYQSYSRQQYIPVEKNINSMSKDDVWGSVYHSSEQELPYFYKLLDYLHSLDPKGVKSKTVAKIMEEKILPEKKISEKLLNERPILSQKKNNNLCGDGMCDQMERKDPNLCPKDCNYSLEITGKSSGK